MVIDSVHLCLCEIQLGVAYATHTLNKATSLIVELRSGKVSGWGEVMCPRPDLQWDWALRIAPFLIKRNWALKDDLIGLWPTDRPKLKESDCSTYCHPNVDQVAEAVSIAVHDLAARKQKVPLRDLLGRVERTKIPAMPVITLFSADKTRQAAEAWMHAGYRHLKLKFSGVLSDDRQRIATLRSVAPDIDLQVDANSGYPDLPLAIEAIELLNDNNVSVVEDVCVAPLDDYRRLRDATAGKFMVDKEAYWPNVREVLKHQCADIVNLHPHNQGSLTNALSIARAAVAGGIEAAIGSSGIFGIQDAAFQQLASVVGLTRPCEDIGQLPYFEGPAAGLYNFNKRPTVTANAHEIIDGHICLNDDPGLGVEVDRRLLRDVTVRQADIVE